MHERVQHYLNAEDGECDFLISYFTVSHKSSLGAPNS